jgi:hypothetical protein
MITVNESHLENTGFQPESTTTLRRTARRDIAAAIARASDYLRPSERALAKAFFEDGRSATEIARLAAVEPRSIRRRVQRLAARVTSDRFVFTLRHLATINKTRRRVAAACILNGLSLRQAADELGLPIHIVRDHVLAVNAMLERRIA